MIWLTWRQHRRETLILGLIFAAIVGYLLVTGAQMYFAYDQMTGGVSVALCQQPQYQQNGICASLSNAFSTQYSNNQLALIGLLFLPPLVGMFLGAPLVARELETGTFRLVWTQSVTRLRWLLTKLGAQIGLMLALSAALALLVHWWRGPFGVADTEIDSPVYAIVGIVPLAYIAFALALGVAAGALLRKVIPAMFATLAVYIGVALAIYNWGRPNFVPPLTQTWDSSVVNGPRTLDNHAWILYYGYLNKSGQRVSMDTAFQACAPSGAVDYRTGSAYTACVHAHGWLSTIIWQPASRYWLFQGIESGILVALALLLIGLTVWWVGRRLG